MELTDNNRTLTSVRRYKEKKKDVGSLAQVLSTMCATEYKFDQLQLPRVVLGRVRMVEVEGGIPFVSLSYHRRHFTAGREVRPLF